jgi:hypothetical protein
VKSPKKHWGAEAETLWGKCMKILCWATRVVNDVSQEVGKVVLECSNSTIVGVSYNRVPQSGWFIGEHPKIFHG